MDTGTLRTLKNILRKQAWNTFSLKSMSQIFQYTSFPIIRVHKLPKVQVTKAVQSPSRSPKLSNALFGCYYIIKRTRQIAANLAIYAANCISIDYFLCLIIISSHSILIKSQKFQKKFQNSQKIQKFVIWISWFNFAYN